MSADEDRRIPLSLAQERIWYVASRFPNRPYYHIVAAYYLRGEVAPDALSCALNEVQTRHDALRTSYGTSDEGPYQVVRREFGTRLEVQAMPRGVDAEAIVRGAISAEYEIPFDLVNGPLMRAKLFVSHAGGPSVFVLAFHHLVWDAQSLSIFLSDLDALYRHNVGGSTELQLTPARQYAEYARRQRAEVSEADLTRHRDWWLRYLADPPARPNLPTDHPRALRGPHANELRENFLWIPIPDDHARRVTTTARAHRCTPFMLQTAAAATLVALYSQEWDVCVRMHATDRIQPGLERLIGMCAHDIAVRLDMRDQPTAASIFKRTRASVLAAIAHRHVRFPEIVTTLWPSEKPNNTCLYSLYCYQMGPDSRTTIGALAAEPVWLGGSSSFDLKMGFKVPGPHFCLGIAYREALWTEQSVRVVADHFIGLLLAMCRFPDCPVESLPISKELTQWAASRRH